MNRRIVSLSLAGVMLAGLFGCTPSSRDADPPAQTPQTAEPPSQTAGPAATGAQSTGATLPSLLGDLPVLYDTALTPSVPEFTVEADLSNVVNADLVEYWNEDAKQALVQNGFVVTDGNREFYEGYETNRYTYTPNFVTTDALLHTYHLYFVYLQGRVEKNELSGELLALSRAMQQQSQAQYDALQGTEWENAALRDLAYFTVGTALLEPETPLPDAVADVVTQELALIDAAAGNAESPVMNLGGADPAAALTEDYTQYIPRSYYAGDEVLERYFRAMMWYGRMTFRASDADQTRSALLLTLALRDGEAKDLWQRIYSVTAFFAGTADDATCMDYDPLLTAAYGEDVTAAALPGNDGAFAAFRDSLSALAPAAVNSMPVYEDQDRDEATAGLRFMGQRYTLDAAAFQRLVYREVDPNARGEQRMLPDALDLPAALGSDTALAILTEQGDTDYPNYDARMQAVRTALAQASDAVWSASLYAAWLNALRPLTETKGEGWPQYMRTDAWARKDLSTMLGSWTELKHDTALYAKQIYAEMGGPGYEERDDRGWVETEPVVFGRLSALSAATAEGLASLGLLEDADAENLDILAELCRRLMVIAEKELKNELPTDEEFELIKTIGGQLEHFWTETVYDEDAGIYSPQQAPAALVADVATDPNGAVRQVGTDVDSIYVIVSVDGSLRIACGSVFAFYQFDRPMSQRMTDSQWWFELGYGPDEEGNWNFDTSPQRPAWANYTLERVYD